MSSPLAPSVVTHRDPNGRKFVSVVEGEYNKARLTEEEARRVNETSGLADLVSKFISDNRCANRFAGEERASSYTYPPEYTGPKSIGEQITTLAKMLNLNPTSALAFAKKLPALPEGAEYWFAIPSPVALAAKHFPNLNDPAEQYCAGVSLILSMIAASRDFCNYREGEITTAQLRVGIRTADALAQIIEAQDMGDILIIAAQFGLLHRGESVRRAREKFSANEFGLSSLIVGSISLTHPERFAREEQLNIDCAGDEFSPEVNGDFGAAPCFDFDCDGFGFGVNWVGSTGVSYGSASAFLPQ